MYRLGKCACAVVGHDWLRGRSSTTALIKRPVGVGEIRRKEGGTETEVDKSPRVKPKSLSPSNRGLFAPIWLKSCPRAFGSRRDLTIMLYSRFKKTLPTFCIPKSFV